MIPYVLDRHSVFIMVKSYSIILQGLVKIFKYISPFIRCGWGLENTLNFLFLLKPYTFIAQSLGDKLNLGRKKKVTVCRWHITSPFFCLYLLFFKFNFIYFWLCWVCVAMWAFSSCGEWASSCSVISCSRAQGPRHGALSSVAPELSSCGSWALEHRLSSCGAQA